MGDEAAPATRPRKQEQEDASEDVVEVAPGVLRMMLPINFTGLGHVNMYGLVDDRGVAIIDPGMPGPRSYRHVEKRLRDAGIPTSRIHSVIVTHSHPDHYGAAGKLAKEADAQLITHAAFQTFFGGAHRCLDPTHGHDEGGDEACEELVANDAPWSRPTPWGTSFHRPPAGRRLQMSLFRNVMRRRFAPPAPTTRVRGGDVLRLAGRDLFAVYTPGHTTDHLCLHDPEAGLLFSGDHVLPTITPHIAGLGQDPDPLARFFASLDACAALEDVTTVLPAHGHPFEDLPGRVKAIKGHHDDRLGQLRDASADLGWASVVELSQQIFQPRVWGSMAESETYAHLEHLVLLGEAEKRGEGLALQYLVHPAS
jgi:glyoxylase-like metal-dependent hydrolase (beta-lactamase superfamily II)